MPELTNAQKGQIGQYLITGFSRISPNAHPGLYKILVNDLQANRETILDRCDAFNLSIVGGSSDDALFVDPQELTWRYSKGEPERTKDGRPISYDDIPAWRPDAIIVAQFSEGRALSTFDQIEYPVEIKTGNYASFERDQREAFIHASNNIRGIPLLIEVNISNLPQSYDITIRRYVEDREQIRKYSIDTMDAVDPETEEKMIR